MSSHRAAGPLRGRAFCDLRNRGAEVLDRVLGGQSLVVTRDGSPVAELWPLTRRGPSPSELIARRRTLPSVSPERLRSDIDAVVDATL